MGSRTLISRDGSRILISRDASRILIFREEKGDEEEGKAISYTRWL